MKLTNKELTTLIISCEYGMIEDEGELSEPNKKYVLLGIKLSEELHKRGVSCLMSRSWIETKKRLKL